MADLSAPRDDLIRSPYFVDADWAEELRAKTISDGNTLYGHMAVFDRWTVINSWEGKFLERMAPGFFRSTLKQRGDRVKILFNHGMDPTIGDKPLGKPDVLREDKVGLYHETPLDETSYNADLRSSLKSGAIDGQSFRFSVTRDEWNMEPKKSSYNPDRLPERTLVEGKLYEGGPVTFPAYEATTAGIRSRAAFGIWLATPPALRLAALNGELILPSDAADDRTSEEPPDAPAEGHPSGPQKALRRRAAIRERGINQ